MINNNDLAMQLSAITSRFSPFWKLSVLVCLSLLLSIGCSNSDDETIAQIKVLQVAPVYQRIASGTSLFLSAIGVDAKGKTRNVTNEVVWSSSNEQSAQFSTNLNTYGLVQAKEAGNVGINASLGTLNAQTVVTITDANLITIEISPSPLNLPKGLQIPLIATGVFDDDSSQDLSHLVTWSTTATDIVAVNASIIEAKSAGTAEVMATFNNIVATTTINVTDATLEEMEITPVMGTIALGREISLQAIGRFSDQSILDITPVVTWTSLNTGIVTIDNSVGAKGEMIALGLGDAVVQASLGEVVQALSLTVSDANLIRLELTPIASVVSAGTTLQFQAYGIYSDNTKSDLTKEVLWLVSNTALAMINNDDVSAGLLTPLPVTQVESINVTVIANYEDVTARTTLTITKAALLTMQVVRDNIDNVAKGERVVFSAIGWFSDKSQREITDKVIWESSDTQVMTISNATGQQGIAQAVNSGEAIINARLSQYSSSLKIKVSEAVLERLEISTPTTQIPLGVPVQLTATGYYSDGSTVDLTSQVTWDSGTDSVIQTTNATGNEGVVTPLAAGDSVITVSFEDFEATFTLEATPAVLTKLNITPTNSQLKIGSKAALTATGVYSDGATFDLTKDVIWAVDDKSIATIDNVISNGVVTAKKTGETKIKAAFASIETQTSLSVIEEVLPSTPKSISVSAVPSGIVSDGIDTTTINLAVSAEAIVVDGTVIELAITSGSGTLSQSSVTTVAGQASVTLSSTAVGTVTVTATVANTSISNSTVIAVVEAIEDLTSPVAIQLSAAPNVILNNGVDANADYTMIKIAVQALGPDVTVADGTSVDLVISNGSGNLSQQTVTTDNGLVSATFSSTTVGTVIITATVTDTNISNDVIVTVVDNFADVIVITSSASGNVVEGNVQVGARFAMVINNSSNRFFTLEKFQLLNDGNVIFETEEAIDLNDDFKLSGGETTAIVKIVTEPRPNRYRAIYYLTAPRLTEPRLTDPRQVFTVSADYTL